jgi:hypothetical protein
MARFIQTASFRSQTMFDPDRDDPVVNALLEDIQRLGGEVTDVQVALAANLGAFVATYLIVYEADRPLAPSVPTTGGMSTYYFWVGLLGALVLVGLVVWMLFAAGSFG